MTPPTGELRASETASYASGSIATGVFNAVPSLLLLYFCTEILLMDAALSATIVLLPKLWILFWDPFVGTWSDRASSRWGRRIPFMATGAVLASGSFVALFAPPQVNAVLLMVWTAVSYFALMSGYSLFAVPYMALPSEIVAQPDSRSGLVKWRMMCSMSGVLVSVGAAPLLVALLGGGRGGYAWMGLVLGASCLIAMTAPILLLRRRGVTRTTPGARTDGAPALAYVGQALRNSRFRALAIAQILQTLAGGVMTAAIPYMVTRGLGRPASDMGILLLISMVAALLAIPVWSMLGRRLGEGRFQAIAALTHSLGAALVGGAVLMSAPWWLVIVITPVMGAGFGGIQVLSTTIAAHLIHEGASGKSEASFMGIWTGSERLGLALGPTLTGFALAIWGGSLALWVVIATPTAMIMSLPFLWAATGTYPLRSAGSRFRELFSR